MIIYEVLDYSDGGGLVPQSKTVTLYVCKTNNYCLFGFHKTEDYTKALCVSFGCFRNLSNLRDCPRNFCSLVLHERPSKL